MTYQRPQARLLASRLAEQRRFVHVVAGPRQVGKSTVVQQVVEASGLPHRIASADEPTQCETGRAEAATSVSPRSPRCACEARSDG